MGKAAKKDDYLLYAYKLFFISVSKNSTYTGNVVHSMQM